MKEDTLSIKELIIAIRDKCPDAINQLNLLSKHIEKLKSAQAPKLKKKDCLNPTFLIRLSQCGQNIRLILTDALSRDFPKKQKLQRQYNEYMQVIYDIRKYHQEAHLAHDMHKYSTNQKNTLLKQLNEQTKRREQLEAQLEFMVSEYRKQLQVKDRIIRELQERMDNDDMVNISQISKISKRGIGQGQLYGGESKVGKIQTDYELSVETARLRKRIVQLQAEVQQRETHHREQIQNQKVQILQLQSKFQQLMRTSTVQNGSIKTVKQQITNQYQQFTRLLLIQSSSIEQYINQQEEQQ